MIRSILKHGDTVLQTPAREVDQLTDELRTLIDDMIETMYAAPGVGLAAPQVGVSRRVFVADPSAGRREDALVVMVNPVLVTREGVQTESEGCLSLPGFEAPVPRPGRVVVQGLDRDGRPQEIEADGLLARVFQHEIDHLNGMLFLDRLHGLKRDMILRKLKKLRRSGKW